MSDLRISCLYPILFREGTYIKHSFMRYSPKSPFDKLTAANCPSRYAHLLHVNAKIHYISLTGDTALLNQAWRRLQLPDGAGHFVPAECGCNLIYDARYGMFLMDFYLAITVTKVPEGSDATPSLNLQANIRKMLVLDPRVDSTPCEWALQIQRQCLSKVQDELTGRIAAEHIEIPASMGYIISEFPASSDLLPSDIRKEVIANFHRGDRLAEQRLKIKKLPISATDREVFLGWQSSTIWGVPAEDCRQLLPVFLTIQIVYSMYSTTFMRQTEELFEEIFYYDEERFRHLQARTDRMLILMDKTVHDKNVFSSKLRPIQLSAFQVLWDYWAMQEMIDACEHSLNSSKRSLEMNINIIHEKMGERQNNLLFVLAIIQIVAMLGIINDYIALNDRYALLSAVILSVLILITIVVFFFSYYERIVSIIKDFLGND